MLFFIVLVPSLQRAASFNPVSWFQPVTLVFCFFTLVSHCWFLLLSPWKTCFLKKCQRQEQGRERSVPPWRAREALCVTPLCLLSDFPRHSTPKNSLTGTECEHEPGLCYYFLYIIYFFSHQRQKDDLALKDQIWTNHWGVGRATLRRLCPSLVDCPRYGLPAWNPQVKPVSHMSSQQLSTCDFDQMIFLAFLDIVCYLYSYCLASFQPSNSFVLYTYIYIYLCSSYIP